MIDRAGRHARTLARRIPSEDEIAQRFPWTEIARATGGETILGNELSLQFEGPTTFSAWLESIESAKKFVYFENYLVRDDRVGRRFRDVLVEWVESLG